jgi:uncharacterized protein (TIGR02246 family)
VNAQRISLFCLFVAAALFLPTVIAAADKEEGGVKSVDDAWQAALIKGDVDAVVACYADDAIFWTPHDDAKGKDAIREVFSKILADTKVIEIRMEDTQYRTVGDRSVGWGTFTILLKPKDGGDEQTIRGRFTEVAEKRNGKWVYVVDHASENPQK